MSNGFQSSSSSHSPEHPPLLAFGHAEVYTPLTSGIPLTAILLGDVEDRHASKRPCWCQVGDAAGLELMWGLCSVSAVDQAVPAPHKVPQGMGPPAEGEVRSSKGGKYPF